MHILIILEWADQVHQAELVDTIGVHHGADDNASGVAMMLELAEKFAGTKGSHKRSIICIAFTGEEEGLLGSKYFTDAPGIDLSKVNAMINLDMVGRLNETNNLTDIRSRDCNRTERSDIFKKRYFSH